jgi:hypothetical protein
MVEVLVVCPDCGLYAKVFADSEQPIIDDEAECKHRQDPTNCPMLRPGLSIARQEALAKQHCERFSVS